MFICAVFDPTRRHSKRQSAKLHLLWTPCLTMCTRRCPHICRSKRTNSNLTCRETQTKVLKAKRTDHCSTFGWTQRFGLGTNTYRGHGDLLTVKWTDISGNGKHFFVTPTWMYLTRYLHIRMLCKLSKRRRLTESGLFLLFFFLTSPCTTVASMSTCRTAVPTYAGKERSCLRTEVLIRQYDN